MIVHTGSVVSDSATSKAFYATALGAIGLSLLMESSASVTGSADVAGFGAPGTMALGLSSKFWLAGGRDNGAPGPRPQHHPNDYGAFVLDPGDNIAAVCHAPA